VGRNINRRYSYKFTLFKNISFGYLFRYQKLRHLSAPDLGGFTQPLTPELVNKMDRLIPKIIQYEQNEKNKQNKDGGYNNA
jgi:hypothetical protein